MNEDFEMQKEYDFSQAKRGPIVPPKTDTTTVTIRLDNEILTWLREQVQASGGGNYQQLINQILQQHIQSQPNWEKTFRKIIREELNLAIQSSAPQAMAAIAK